MGIGGGVGSGESLEECGQKDREEAEGEGSPASDGGPTGDEGGEEQDITECVGGHQGMSRSCEQK